MHLHMECTSLKLNTTTRNVVPPFTSFTVWPCNFQFYSERTYSSCGWSAGSSLQPAIPAVAIAFGCCALASRMIAAQCVVVCRGRVSWRDATCCANIFLCKDGEDGLGSVMRSELVAI